MSHIDDSKALRPRSPDVEAPNEKPSRSKVWEQVFNPPHVEHDRMLVERSRPSEHVGQSAENNAPQSRVGETEQRPRHWLREERSYERLGPSGRRTEEKSSSNSPETHIDAVYNSAGSKNVTAHLEFDIINDLEDEVEEFNRLVRRGDFADARSFFNDHLASHSTNPWIFVQYAEMLLEMGDYKSFHQLNPEPVFATLSSDPSEDARTLERHWKLLKASVLCCSQYELQPISDELCQPYEIIPVPENIGSTEVRNVCLAMRVSYVADEANTGPSFPGNLATWGNWAKIYQGLLLQGRVWDFRDLFISAYRLFGSESVERQFFGSRNTLEALNTDWLTTEQDESTLLALLDILVFLVLDSDVVEGVPAFAEQCLQSASPIAESIMEKFPHDVKSRPFLQWILAQSSTSARRGKQNSSDFDYLLDFTGKAIFPVHIGLPFYIPVRQENPGWMPSDMPLDSLQPLEMVLNATKETNDYSTQALCLMELAVRTRQPGSIFDEIARLQRDVQQNMAGYLTTCISKYLIAQDADSKAKLLRELNDLGSWKNPSDLISPVKACTRDIIQEALSTRHNRQQKSIKAGVRYYNWLPRFFRDLIDRHVEHPRSKHPRPVPYLRPPEPFLDRDMPSTEEREYFPRHNVLQEGSQDRKHQDDVTATVRKVTEQPSGPWNPSITPAPPPSRALIVRRPTVEEGDDSSDGVVD